jgi:hypothetical protein
VVRDAAGADLAEGGGGGNSSSATRAEAEAHSEWGELGAGSGMEDGSRGRRRVAGGEGRRHGCRDGHERALPLPLPRYSTEMMGKRDNGESRAAGPGTTG